MISLLDRTGCVFALVLCAASGALAQDIKTVRPDGLDGLAVVRSPLPSPFAYLALRNQSAELIAAGKFSDAEALIDRLVAEYPIDGQNWLLDGKVKRKLGKFDDAAKAYRRAIALLGPGVPGMAEYWLAVSAAAGGSTESALDALNELVAEQHYLHRPSLYGDDNLKTLHGQSRFDEIAGHLASATWTRDDGWRHDIDYLVSELRRVNPDYHDRPLPEVFERLHRDLLASVPRLNDEQIYVGMSRMLASLNQGHTNLWPFIPASKMTFKALPVQFYVFPEGIYIVAANPGNEDLIGSELVKIETTSAMEALRQIRQIHASDSGMEVLWLGPSYLSLAQELKGLGIAHGTDQIEITVRAHSGAISTRKLTTASLGGSPKLGPPPGLVPPLSFRNPDKAHWLESLPDAEALYIQVNQIADDPEETLEEFGLRLRSILRNDAIRNVILDLRNNNGGNTFSYVELLRTLIGFSQNDGRKIYVLIGRGVYSAAANLVTDLERLASPVFVGEPTSMTGNNYGDESEVSLPYSGIWAGLTGAKWQLGYPYDLRRAVVPTVPVVITAGDYFGGRDPVLDTAKSLCVPSDRRSPVNPENR